MNGVLRRGPGVAGRLGRHGGAPAWAPAVVVGLAVPVGTGGVGVSRPIPVMRRTSLGVAGELAGSSST